MAGQPAALEAPGERIAKQAESVPELFAGLGADKPKIKYGCLKALRLLSEKEPAVLYPEFDRFAAMLDSENNIFKGSAIIIVGNLAAADPDEKIGPILDRHLAPISGPVMITAGNAIAGAGRIARAKPRFADGIARALLKVEAANYQTPECRNMALGHVVKSLDLFFEQVKDPKPVMALVRRQPGNSRNAVKKNAAAFLKRHGGASAAGLEDRAGSISAKLL
jgi:hypothetical protein